MVKVNDVIEMKMYIDAIDAQEVELKNDISKCKRRFDIKYSLNGEWYSSTDFELDEDDYVVEFDDIEEFIKSDLKYAFEEVTEYEILSVDKKDYLSQKIKIKVTKIQDEKNIKTKEDLKAEGIDSINKLLEKYGQALSPREKDIVRLSTGADDNRTRTVEEIAELFCVEADDIEEKLKSAKRKIHKAIKGK